MTSYFSHTIRITMAHVDVAGLIFFPRIYELCEEALEFYFEDALKKRFESLLYEDGRAAIIVHSEADYQKPIRIGDRLLIKTSCTHVGKTSFTIKFLFINEKEEQVAEAKTVHVLMNLKKHEKVEIPEIWKKKLQANMLKNIGS